MTQSILNEYNPKRNMKTPHRRSSDNHRRATVDNASLSRPPIPHELSGLTRPMRRHSLQEKKSVQFSSLSEVCLVEHHGPSFAYSSWYNGLDQLRFKRERMSDVLSFRNKSRKTTAQEDDSAASAASKGPCHPTTVRPESPCCPVGLEQLLSKGSSHEAQSRRRIVIQTVLLEQHRQRIFGYKDPDKIAFLYERATADSLQGAQRRGKFQEMAKFV
ncbi:hypothetical protein ACHAXA_008400 [Cyclostephanos tholiformis]|uniref:Uncharacterized protein n=1 Tax=Cyclostephanos tholiformis TaxID=382380 RepID=A0ABD3RVU1_9STRA